MISDLLARATQILTEEVIPVIRADESHGIRHYMSVVEHSLRVLDETSLGEKERVYVVLASLLHDVDDLKVTGGKYPPLHWATYVLGKLNVERFPTLLMIDLVSCSKNGDSYDKSHPWWYYLPRYSDRLESIGKVGVERLLAYNASIGRPLHCEGTERVRNMTDLLAVASRDRYEDYVAGVRGKHPVSAIDIIYDKLFHVSLPDWLVSPYLAQKFTKRKEYIAEWVINYWLCEK